MIHTSSASGADATKDTKESVGNLIETIQKSIDDVKKNILIQKKKVFDIAEQIN